MCVFDRGASSGSRWLDAGDVRLSDGAQLRGRHLYGTPHPRGARFRPPPATRQEGPPPTLSTVSGVTASVAGWDTSPAEQPARSFFPPFHTARFDDVEARSLIRLQLSS
jgi:hypothetical protein